jgi:hypothetical protein
VPRRPTLLIIALFALSAACGPKSGGGGPRPVDLGAFPALKYVPGDVTYAASVSRVGDMMLATRDLFEAIGIIAEFDLEDLDRALKNYLGINLISPEDLASAGLDVAGGAAIFSQGISATIVFRLSDPVAMQGRIDAQRERVNNTIGVAVRDGVDVHTDLGDREMHTSWAIDGSWMWVHFELVAEHEPELGWFEASRAANGAIVKDPDFTWARGEAERVQPGAPLVALIRPSKLAMKFAAAVNDPEFTTCLGLVTPPRAAMTMGVGGGVSEGHVIVDLAGAGAAIAAATVKVPQGWSAARGQAPLAAEWNVDAFRVASWLSACDQGPMAMASRLGVRAIRGFITALDPGNLEGRGAVAAEISDRRQIDRMMDFTGRSMFEKKKKFGPLDGVTLSAPMIPTVDYILTADRAMAAVGDGLLAQVVGDGSTASGVLAAIELRPAGLTKAAWSFLLENAADVRREGAREDTIRRLNRWKLATFEVTLEGDLLHVRARGERP